MFSRKNLDIILSQQNPISCLDLNFQFFLKQKQKPFFEGVWHLVKRKAREFLTG